ncbi:MAG TPA: hypothetical protein VGI14_09375 [Casimicrobiaceae bacterium]
MPLAVGAAIIPPPLILPPFVLSLSPQVVSCGGGTFVDTGFSVTCTIDSFGVAAFMGAHGSLLGQTVDAVADFSSCPLPDALCAGYGAVASLDYFFGVTGPPGVVKVDVGASGDTDAAGGSGVASAVLILDRQVVANGCSDAGASNCAAGGPPIPATWIFSAEYPVATNTAHEVAISAFASVGIHGHAGASVDPFLFIDPSTPNAEQYRLIFSDGIGPGTPPAAAPEPPTVALLIAGFAAWGLGKMRSRRERARPRRRIGCTSGNANGPRMGA